MTIYDIKRLVSETSPKYFSRNTLKFFGQTMKGCILKNYLMVGREYLKK